jgi:vancomycin resistance protein VanJ
MSETLTTSGTQRNRGCIVRMFELLAGTYGLVVTVLLILRSISGDTFLPIAVYSTLGQWLWLGALFLLLPALLLRTWRAIPFLLLPAAAWLFAFGLRFLNTGEETRRSGITLTAVTYNIQWRNEPYDETLALIREMNADIVALQEISLQAAAQLEETLTDLYPHMALDPLEWGYSGQAFLSKYPILEHDFFEFGVNAASFGQQRLVIDHPSYPIVVYNVHLLHPLTSGLNFVPRANEMRALSRRIRDERAPHIVVMGDFNMSDLNDDYEVIAGLMRDAYRDAGTGIGLTHTLRIRGIDILRWMRLDYIFTTGALDPINARVMSVSGGSDHAPVWAQIEVYDPTASYPEG